jgi:hypothetical protein
MRYAPELDKRCRLQLKATNDSYRVDETYMKSFSRRLGPALHARSRLPQKRECLLRVLTHNLMILRLVAQVFNRAEAFLKPRRVNL